MDKSPVFVSGIGRSGTSAVISALSEHANVVSPNRIGEAPLIQEFLNFLRDFENESPYSDYHLENYQLEKADRIKLYSSMVSSLQYGFDVSQAPAEQQYWIAKVSLSEENYLKALEVFGDVKVIHVMRNGIEVVNSARHFEGFSDLSFEQLCNRWTRNLDSCQYLTGMENCSVIRHDELITDPHKVFANVFSELNMPLDDAPAHFIKTTLFNSSFNKTEQNDGVAKVFNNRLSCWDEEWTDSERDTFITLCGQHMEELGFQRPYVAGDMEAPEQQEVVSAAVENVTPIQRPTIAKAGLKTPTLTKLAENCVPINFLDYHCNVSLENEYFHMENPKVASTSILKRLQEQENRELAEQMPNPHERGLSPIARISSLSEVDQKNVLNDPDFYRFAFVRNPFARLLSAYISKIDRSLLPKAEILAVLKGVDAKEITDLTEPVDFPTFIDVICSQDRVRMDPHWNHQCDQLIIEKIDYHKIGRFENLESDFKEVCEKIFPGREINLTQSANKTGSTDLISEYFDEGLTSKVYQVFYDDFNAFGYSSSFGSLAKTA